MNLFLSLLILLLFGCATVDSNSTSQGRDVGITIENQFLDKDDNSSIVTPYLEDGSTYGPFPQGQTSDPQIDIPKKTINALVLGPGGYRTFAYIGTIRALSQHEHRVDILVGSEMSAIIAAFYARGDTGDMIEWNIFKLLNRIKSNEFMSDEWIDELNDFLVEEFRQVRIEELKKTLLLPKYNIKRNIIEYTTKGSVVRNLMYYFPREKERTKKKNFFSYGNINCSKLKHKGADHILGVDVLNDDITFENGSGLFSGIYGRADSTLKKQMKCFDLLVRIDGKNHLIDSYENIHHLTKIGFDQTYKTLKKLKDKNYNEN